MVALRTRTIAQILSITALILSIFLLTRLSFDPNNTSLFYLNLLAAVIFTFNIAILLGWASLGTAAGVAMIIISYIVVVISILRIRHYEYSVCVLPFLVTGMIGYFHTKSRLKTEQCSNLGLENLTEDINVISNDVKKKNIAISSIEEKLVRYSFLKDVAESLSTVLSLEDINNIIIEKTLKILGKNGRVLLFLVDAQKQELSLASSKDAGLVHEKKGDNFDKWVLRHRKNLMIEDIHKDFRFPADEIKQVKNSFASLIAVPLVSESKVIGVLRVDSPQKSMYAQDDLRLLDIVANLGAVAVQNAILYSRTQELAIKDSLTGLAVRRYFMERFSEELNRAARKKQPLAILLLDIDHFKDYNDKFGHAAGDIVLKHIARIMKASTREGDIVGRYGGEEIVALLYGRSKAQAVEEAEKIRSAVSEKTLILRRREIGVTVSIGASSYPDDGINEEELMRVADERLYKAKTLGRNKVCSD